MITRTLIQAVPWDPARARRAADLRERLDGEVVWDTEFSALATWMALLTVAGTNPVVVLEDDVIPVPNWRERVEVEIRRHPFSVINFFCTGERCPDLSGWMDGAEYWSNLCVYLPARAARDILAICERAPRAFADMHDLSVARFLVTRRRRFWQHVPSLVQHEDWVSVVKERRSRARQSAHVE